MGAADDPPPDEDENEEEDDWHDDREYAIPVRFTGFTLFDSGPSVIHVGAWSLGFSGLRPRGVPA